MELHIKLRQAQRLSPQMLRSMEILQMGAQELRSYLEDLAQENPVLEAETPSAGQDGFGGMLDGQEWPGTAGGQDGARQREGAVSARELYSEAGTMTLADSLQGQLRLLELEKGLRQTAEFIVGCLDPHGWLDEDVESLAALLGCSETRIEEGLRLVQGLDPAGVGARDLSECLRLQLMRAGEEEGSLCLRIVDGELENLAKSRFSAIARKLGESPQAVRAACRRIQGLRPRPGMGFSTGGAAAYVIPDVAAVRREGGLEAAMNESSLPALRLNGYYRKLLKETDDSEVKGYLSGKLRQAKSVIYSVEQRRSTLLRCTQCILELQEDFFSPEGGELRPLTLSDVAERVGVHPSTVSRAIRDKYLQCGKGVYPLRSFFSRELGARNGTGASSDFAHSLLRRLIGEEDKRAPLSDQKLCERMAAHGCLISRRTVAKYRSELSIPGAAGRRQDG